MADGKSERGRDEVIAICENLPQNPAEGRILTVRGTQVILDRDLAELYGVRTSRLNEQVKRNLKRFPERFRFQLTAQEVDEVVSRQDRLVSLKYSPSKPYAFTEQGVAMLSSVLHSDEAIAVNILIMDAFVAMRRFLLSHAQIFQRLERMEYKQIEADHKFEQIFSMLEEKEAFPKRGVFFDGQIFDAYDLICSLIRKAGREIILIDNYVDETVLTMLDKRQEGVQAVVYTQGLSKQLALDVAKHNAQYRPVEVRPFNRAHDRFLIIDEKVYHIGASLKDLGKKWFAFSLLQDISPQVLVERISTE